MQKFKINNIENTIKFENYISSSLVDIIITYDIIENSANLSVENDINLCDEEDKRWIKELIQNGLNECNEKTAKIIFD